MYVDDRDLKGCLKRGAARIELCREKERERGSVCIYIVFSRESFWEICQLMVLENKQVIYIDYKKEKKIEDRVLKYVQIQLRFARFSIEKRIRL